jgi:hypothetical protein
MTPETLNAGGPEPKGMSEPSRLTGVFFEPSKAFEDIAARPNPWVPLILAIVVGVVLLSLFSQHVGWERMVRHQFETSSRAQQMAPEAREQAIQMQLKILPVVTYLGPIIGTPLSYLIWAAILLGIVKGIMSAPVRFKQVFAAVCYGTLPWVLFGILCIVVMYLKPPDDFNLQNPLVFNPGAFLDPVTSPKFVYSLASSLDLFTLWVLFLIGIGLKAAGGRKFSTGSAMTAVFLPWVIYTLGKALLAGAFGS